MEIIFLGHASFRIKGKKVALVTDPFDPSVGFAFPKVTADIVTVSHDHQDHAARDKIEGRPFVISAPGEYEVKETFILGVSTFHDASSGSQRGTNTVFVFEIDGLRICHLGDLGHKLTDKQLEEIGSVDILMIPTGGFYTIGPEQGVEVISQIQPRVAIPMHYRTERHEPQVFEKLATVEDFLKATGDEAKRLPKLTVSKDSLPEEQEIVVLEAKSG